MATGARFERGVHGSRLQNGSMGLWDPTAARQRAGRAALAEGSLVRETLATFPSTLCVGPLAHTSPTRASPTYGSNMCPMHTPLAPTRASPTYGFNMCSMHTPLAPTRASRPVPHPVGPLAHTSPGPVIHLWIEHVLHVHPHGVVGVLGGVPAGASGGTLKQAYGGGGGGGGGMAAGRYGMPQRSGA